MFNSNIFATAKNKLTKATCLIVASSSLTANAKLPQSTAYTADAADGNYSKAFMAMFKDNASVGIIIIGVMIFCAAAYAVISAFMEYRAGKKELGDVGTVALIGAVIVTISFFLLTQAESMLA